MTFKPGRVVRSRGPDAALPTGQNDKGSLKSYLYKYTKYSKNRTNSTVEMVLPDPCERPHRQCFMSAPIHTHTCTHTSITRCMHLLCTARVHTLQFFTLQVSRLHSMRSCIRMLMMHSHIHLPTHTHIFIHTHITTLADTVTDTSAISLATTSQHSQARQQEQSQSHSHPLL